MRRTLLVLLILGVLAAQFAHASASSPGQTDVPRPSAQVEVRPYREGREASFNAVPGEVNVLYRRGVAPARRTAVATRIGARLIARVPSIRMQTLRLGAAADVAASIRRLSRMPGVAWAEPNYRLRPLSNDPFFNDQWGLANTGQAHLISGLLPATSIGIAGADVDAEAAWATQTGAGATVAVIDTGVDTDHPELVNQLTDPSTWANVSGDGPVTDPNPNPSEEDFSHGTHVAASIAAEQGNAIGVSGVCPGCRIMPIRFGFTVSSEVQAIAWAADHGADVINASFGRGGLWSMAERNAIKAAGAAGVLFVAAAGNAGADNDIATLTRQGDILSPSFPASYELPSILAVAASNHKDEYGYLTGCVEIGGFTRAQCSFTSFGHASVDVAAPGTDIISAVVPGDGTQGPLHEYDVFDGTSSAASMTAGIAGLVIAAHPTYSPVQIKNAILNTVEKPTSLKQHLRITSCPACALTGGSFSRTNGRLNAASAINGDIANATKRDDGTIAGALGISTKRSGAVDWPSDPNDVFRKRLKKGKTYQITIKTFSQRVDVYLWNPTTLDMWQLTAGCLGGPGSCPLIDGASIAPRRVATLRFKAKKGGVHFFVLESFYRTARAGYTITVKQL